MKVAVSGGAGFIGSRLVDKLNESVEAVPIDLQLGHDVLDVASLPALLDGCEVVVHLAGPVAGVVRKKPYEAVSLQVQGTLNVFEAARQVGVRRVVAASSFYVYNGLDGDRVVNELTPLTVHEMEPFGAAKLMTERIAQMYGDAYGIEWAALRFGSVYGAGERASNVVADIMAAGLAGEPFSIWGKGQRRNQYTYVDDVVNGILRAIQAETGVGVLNLISHDVTTTGALAELMRDLFGFEVVFDQDRPDPPSTPYMVSHKAQRLLGWHWRPLDEGIRKTYEEARSAAKVR